MLVDLGAPPPAGQQAMVLAQQGVPPGKGPEFGKASPVGLVVVLLLLLATVFLIRSMGKHLKRVPASFDTPDPDRNAEPATAKDVVTAGDDDGTRDARSEAR